MNERLDEARAGGGQEAEDLSVPMWVWTLLGFGLVVAVVIVVIIWGGGQARQNDQGTGGATPETMSSTEPSAEQPETMPAATVPATP